MKTPPRYSLRAAKTTESPYNLRSSKKTSHRYELRSAKKSSGDSPCPSKTSLAEGTVSAFSKLESELRASDPTNFNRYNTFTNRELQAILKVRGFAGTVFKLDAVATLMYNDSHHAQQPFKFMELPGEIRNMIYLLLLIKERPIDDYNYKFPLLSRIMNKQFRNECLQVYWGYHTVVMRSWMNNRAAGRPACKSYVFDGRYQIALSRLARVELLSPQLFSLMWTN